MVTDRRQEQILASLGGSTEVGKCEKAMNITKDETSILPPPTREVPCIQANQRVPMDILAITWFLTRPGVFW